MGSRQSLTRSTLHHFSISFLILLVLSPTHLRFFNAEGRPMARTIANSKIGSRPPRCYRRCSNCGHCEAIQVPTNPQIRDGHKNSRNATTASTIPYARGDDNSNYKPMSWKCKCGDLIFNP